MAPPSGAYVGYRVLKQPTFFTCLPSYADPLLPPSAAPWINFKSLTCKSKGNSNISGYHFVVQHNNMNGKSKLPQGHVVIQRVRIDYLFDDPCGKTFRVHSDFVEYFKTVPNSDPVVTSKESAAVDNHMALTCCETYLRPDGNKHSHRYDLAIVPKGTNWNQILAGEM